MKIWPLALACPQLLLLIYILPQGSVTPALYCMSNLFIVSLVSPTSLFARMLSFSPDTCLLSAA